MKIDDRVRPVHQQSEEMHFVVMQLNSVKLKHENYLN